MKTEVVTRAGVMDTDQESIALLALSMSIQTRRQDSLAIALDVIIKAKILLLFQYQ